MAQSAFAGVADRRARVEQGLHVRVHAARERDLDEDQRLVRQGRVEEGVAAPVGLEPAPQVAPALISCTASY